VVTPYIGAAAQGSTTVGNVLTTPISGLTNGTSYTFRVAAVNAIGTGNQSGDSNAVTPVAPATVPGAPTIGTATAGNASATVNWTAPASNGGSAITGYVVTPYIGAAAQGSTTVGNVLTTPISGLTNGTTYTFRVAAINAIGTGNQSGDSNAVTPTTIVFRSSSIGQTSGNKGALTLGLARPAGAVVGDVLLASIDVRGTASVTPPPLSTWTLLESRTAGSGATALKKSTYWHTVVLGDPTLYTWSFSAVSTAAGTLVGYGGVDTTTFVAASQANVAAAAVAAPTVTATAAGSRLVGFFTTATNATFTPPTGMAERCEINASSGSVKLASEAADSSLGASGPTGVKTATASKSAVSIGQVIILRPNP
jgi:fibronectin type III domain protein